MAKLLFDAKSVYSKITRNRLIHIFRGGKLRQDEMKLGSLPGYGLGKKTPKVLVERMYDELISMGVILQITQSTSGLYPAQYSYVCFVLTSVHDSI